MAERRQLQPIHGWQKAAPTWAMLKQGGPNRAMAERRQLQHESWWNKAVPTKPWLKGGSPNPSHAEPRHPQPKPWLKGGSPYQAVAESRQLQHEPWWNKAAPIKPWLKGGSPSMSHGETRQPQPSHGWKEAAPTRAMAGRRQLQREPRWNKAAPKQEMVKRGIPSPSDGCTTHRCALEGRVGLPRGCRGPGASSSSLPGRRRQHTRRPPLSPSQWGEHNGRKDRPGLSSMFFGVPHRHSWLEQKKLEWHLAGDASIPLALPIPLAGGRLVSISVLLPSRCRLRCFLCNDAHTTLCFAGGFYFFPWKAPKKPQMWKVMRKASLFSSSSQSSSRATLQINAVRLGFKKRFAEPLPSPWLSHTDQCEDLNGCATSSAQLALQALRLEDKVFGGWQNLQVELKFLFSFTGQ